MRKIIALFLSLPLYFLPIKIAHAIEVCPQDPNSIASKACKFTAGDFGPLVGTIIQAIFVIAVIVALGYLIYGAVRWIISQGDKAKVTDARNHIIAAIIGLVIVFLSYLVINLILGIFFNQSIQDLQLPKFTPVGS
ncbi:MAG: hypothetical protein A2W22_05635 [Candidatus Levybacteria bacterium RBG_16_35_11]|nr:MAG: hypothetical protein A2W22_05635 [Candidatus Levybacteria bacterium RBG_16_35_11]